jgi:DNA topoisomerase IB
MVDKTILQGDVPAGFHTTIEPHQEVVGDVRANGVVVTQEMLDERKKKATENTGHFKYKPGHPNQTFLHGQWMNTDPERDLIQGGPGMCGPSHHHVVLIDNFEEHVKKGDVPVLGWGWNQGAPDGKGGRLAPTKEYYHSERHKLEEQEAKHKRVLALMKILPQVDKRLVADSKKNDVAAAVLLMDRMGFRPGSKATGSSADYDSFAAGTLLKKHVTLDPVDPQLYMEKEEITAARKEKREHPNDPAYDFDMEHGRILQGSFPGQTLFRFRGKSDQPQCHLTPDPDIHAAMAAALKRNKPRTDTSRIFPSRIGNSRGQDELYLEAGQYIKNITGGKFNLKDLRCAKATKAAIRLVKEIPDDERPQDSAEFNAKRLEIAQKVCRQLGNTPPVAIKTYIGSFAFDRIADGTNWADIGPGGTLMNEEDAAGTPTWMVKEGKA